MHIFQGFEINVRSGNTIILHQHVIFWSVSFTIFMYQFVMVVCYWHSHQITANGHHVDVDLIYRPGLHFMVIGSISMYHIMVIIHTK